MDREDLLKKLDQTTNDLLDVLASYDDHQFNKVPFEGSWTAGQVADHLFRSEGGVPKVLTAATEKTERDPEQFVKTLDDIFLDFSTKLKSPEFILPGNGPHSQAEYYTKFSNNRLTVKELASTLDLTQTCMVFKMPGIGHLTRYEMLRFVVAHSTRHIRQLKNIRGRLN